MRRLSLRIVVAALTFTVGIATASLGLIQNRAEPAFESERQTGAATTSESQTEAVAITFKRSYRNEYSRVIAELEIANDSNEILYYRGYDDDDNQFWSVRRGRRSTHYSPSCGTGLEEHQLLPGEHATFHISAGREGGNVQVGFDFQVGKDRLWQTIWSDNFYIP